MANAAETYSALAAIHDPAARLAAANLAGELEAFRASGGRDVVARLEALATRLCIPFPTLRRKYYLYIKGGAAALADGRKVRRGAPAAGRWDELYNQCCENDTNTSTGGWREMMRRLRSGESLPFGLGTWRDVWTRENPYETPPAACPLDWVPEGANEQTLRRHARADAGNLFQIAICRQGMKAARGYLAPVLNSRAGLEVGQVYEFDDCWHNIDVLVPGDISADRVVQPLEFAGYDVASAFKAFSVVKPRVVRADGVRDNMKEQQFRYLFAYAMTRVGFHKDGVRCILERGTTAIRENVERQIRAIPGYGALITLERSGILSEQAHAGLFVGSFSGNPRRKALCEGSHGILQNRMASLPGNRGRDAAHLQESRNALAAYEGRLALAADRLTEQERKDLAFGLMDFSEFMTAMHRLEDELMDDWHHSLEGWDGRMVKEFRYSRNSEEWHNASELDALGKDEAMAIAVFLRAHPDCARMRPMSRRDAWKAGAANLATVPTEEMPAFLDAERDGRMLAVRDNGLLGIRDAIYYGRDEMLYRAAVKCGGLDVAIAPRKKVLALANPLTPEWLWLIDPENGHRIGMAPLYKRAPMEDPEAVKRLLGGQSADLAAKLRPIRARHADEAQKTISRRLRNAQVLAEAGKSNGAAERAADAFVENPELSL